MNTALPPLHTAALHGDRQTITRLLAEGAPFEQLSPQGLTPAAIHKFLYPNIRVREQFGRKSDPTTRQIMAIKLLGQAWGINQTQKVAGGSIAAAGLHSNQCSYRIEKLLQREEKAEVRAISHALRLSRATPLAILNAYSDDAPVLLTFSLAGRAGEPFHAVSIVLFQDTLVTIDTNSEDRVCRAYQINRERVTEDWIDCALRQQRNYEEHFSLFFQRITAALQPRCQPDFAQPAHLRQGKSRNCGWATVEAATWTMATLLGLEDAANLLNDWRAQHRITSLDGYLQQIPAKQRSTVLMAELFFKALMERPAFPRQITSHIKQLHASHFKQLNLLEKLFHCMLLATFWIERQLTRLLTV